MLFDMMRNLFYISLFLLAKSAIAESQLCTLEKAYLAEAKLQGAGGTAACIVDYSSSMFEDRVVVVVDGLDFSVAGGISVSSDELTAYLGMRTDKYLLIPSSISSTVASQLCERHSAYEVVVLKNGIWGLPAGMVTGSPYLTLQDAAHAYVAGEAVLAPTSDPGERDTDTALDKAEEKQLVLLGDLGRPFINIQNQYWGQLFPVNASQSEFDQYVSFIKKTSAKAGRPSKQFRCD